MRVVSNTSPLRYLVAAGHADLLARLFGEILIPAGVADELSDGAAPLQVREWIKNPPEWLHIHPLQFSPDQELMVALDRGEREAIQLAIEQSADLLIMDEWKGRAVVQRRGIPLVGALGILGIAYQQRLIDHPLKILSGIRQQGFHISDSLIAKFKALLGTKYAPER